MNPDREIVNVALCIQLGEDYIGPFSSSDFTPVDVRNSKLEGMHREHTAYSDPSHPHHEVYTGAFMKHYDTSGDVVRSHMAGQNAISTQQPLTGTQGTFASRFRYYDQKRHDVAEEIEIPHHQRHIPPHRIAHALLIAKAELSHREQNDPSYMPNPHNALSNAGVKAIKNMWNDITANGTNIQDGSNQKVQDARILGQQIARYNIHRDTTGQNIDTQG